MHIPTNGFDCARRAPRLMQLCCAFGTAAAFCVTVAHAQVCGGTFEPPITSNVGAPIGFEFLLEPHESARRALELSPGFFLLRQHDQLFTLSFSNAQVARVDGAEEMGAVEHIAPLTGGRALVFAENGLFRVQTSGAVEQLVDCERLGTVASTKNVLELYDGRLILAGSRGVFVLPLEGALQRLTSFGADEVGVAGDGSLLLRTGADLIAVGPDGAPVPISTGAMGSSIVLPLPDRRTLVYDRDGHAMLLSSEGLLPLDFGDEVRARTGPVALQDGSIAWFTDAGIFLLAPGATLKEIAPDIRLDCKEGPILAPEVRSLPLNESLVIAGNLLVAVDSRHAASVLHRWRDCKSPVTIEHSGDANTPYVVAGGLLYRVTAARTLAPSPFQDATGFVRLITAFGDRALLLDAEKGFFVVDANEEVHRLDAPPSLTAEEDEVQNAAPRPDATVVACTRLGKLLRFTAAGEAQRFPGFDGIRCHAIAPLGREFVYVSTPAAHLLIGPGDRVLVLEGMPDWSDASTTWVAADGSLLLYAAGRLFMVSIDGEVKRLDLSTVAIRSHTSTPTLVRSPELAHIIALRFVDAMQGVAIAGPARQVIRSADAGVTWERCIVDGERIEGASALTSSGGTRIWVGTQTGVLYHSVDAGRTWSRQVVGSDLDIFSIGVLDEGTRLLVMARTNDTLPAAVLLESEDGGQTWHDGGESPCVSVSPPSYEGAKAWCVVSELLFETVRIGDPWLVASHLEWNPGSEWLTYRASIPFVIAGFWEDTSGCAIGPAGMICRKDDDDWRKAYSGANLLLDAAFAPQLGRAWAVGTNGTVLFTEDRGQHWTPRSSGTNATLTGVYFLPDGLHGWAWGENGLLSTRDGGVTWKATDATPRESE